MNYVNILNLLQPVCPFPHIFEGAVHTQNMGTTYPRKLVHIRADYDGYRWWNSIWPCHDELATPEHRKEVDSVYASLVSKDAFSDLNSLKTFCRTHPEAGAAAADAFDFYFEGEHCQYWLRCITRSKDYNIYLHAFIKDIATPHEVGILHE